MPYPESGEGFMVDSAETWTQFHKREFPLKKFDDHDVDIQIEACGMCASDIHTITGGWGDQPFPLCVGHEIIGKAVRVGPKVTLIKEGERVGVGAQIYSCLECRQCKNDNETYCAHQQPTYGSYIPGSDVKQMGGFSSHVRTHEFWVYPIPEKLPTVKAAPMLCAGITIYSPLVRNGCGPGKKVGIVGLGGIGHYGVLFAKALGAETWVISRSHAKEADAKALGADGFIATADADWEKAHFMSFDLIVSTANSNQGWDMAKYFSLLDVHAHWVTVGLPEQPEAIPQGSLFSNGCLVGASHLGSRKEMLAMLQLAADKNVESWVEELKLNETNLSEAAQRLRKSDVRYRFSLTGFDEAFPQK